MSMDCSALLPSEAEAVRFVERIGHQRADRILDAICRRITRRGRGMLNTDYLRKTKLELELTHRIKMGLSLTSNNTPSMAHRRIIERIARRHGIQFEAHDTTQQIEHRIKSIRRGHTSA